MKNHTHGVHRPHGTQITVHCLNEDLITQQLRNARAPRIREDGGWTGLAGKNARKPIATYIWDAVYVRLQSMMRYSGSAFCS